MSEKRYKLYFNGYPIKLTVTYINAKTWKEVEDQIRVYFKHDNPLLQIIFVSSMSQIFSLPNTPFEK